MNKNFFWLMDVIVNGTAWAVNAPDMLSRYKAYATFVEVAQVLVKNCEGEFWDSNPMDMAGHYSNLEEVYNYTKDVLYMHSEYHDTVFDTLFKTMTAYSEKLRALLDEIEESPEYKACFED